jgi:hypothetical protein
MKLLKHYKRAFLFVCLLQCVFTFSAFAQSKIENTVNAKCEECQTLLAAENINAFAAGNCRIYKSICDLLQGQNTVILTEYTDNQNFEAAQEIQLSNMTLAFYLDEFKEKAYEVTTQTTLLNETKEVIEVVQTGYFQLYTFDENQNIVAAEGVKTIKKVDENTNQLMMTTMTLPETAKKAAFVQVSLQFMHPMMQTIVLKKMIAPINVAE